MSVPVAPAVACVVSAFSTVALKLVAPVFTSARSVVPAGGVIVVPLLVVNTPTSRSPPVVVVTAGAVSAVEVVAFADAATASTGLVVDTPA